MAIQLELFSSPWVIRARSTAQSVWKNPWVGWLMILTFSCWYAWWCFHIPSPAKAATVLGVIAAIMAYRGEPEGFEKLFWTVVLFSFLFLELNAIDHKDQLDEQAHQMAQRQEQKNFTKIGEGITQGVNGIVQLSNQQFQATVDQQSQQFAATMNKSQASIDAITGGDSFVVVYPDLTDSKATTFPLFLRVCFKCRDSVPGATVLIRPLTAPLSENQEIFSGTVHTAFAAQAYLA